MSQKPNFPLICFDLDGTLVDDTIYIWKTLHEGFKTDQAARKKAFDGYFSGAITYEAWFQHDLLLLRDAGACKKSILALLDQLTPMTGAMDTLRTLRANGHRIAIISGSLDIVVDHLFGDFRFDHLLINRIRFDEQGQIDGGTHTPYDIEHKATGLKALCKQEGISPDQAVFIGDNENDLWIAEAAGKSIAFNCKSAKLARISDVVIGQRNLRAILPHIN